MVIKNVNNLRSFLSEQIEKIVDGELKPDEANAVSMMAANMLLSIKLEMDYNRLQNKEPDIPFMNNNNSNLIVQEPVKMLPQLNKRKK